MKKIFILFTLLCTLWKAEAQNNITQAEYFVDTDPGRGKGTAITIPTPSTNVKNVAFNVTLSTLPEGFHRVYMRTYNGKWSHTNSTMIYKMPASSTLKKITGAEYFIDTDPGRGKGKAISITADFDVSNVSFNVTLSSLSEGFHRLYLRTRDGNNYWSHTSSYMFYKMSVGVSDTTIVQAEYFIDNDPGHGKGTAISINPAKNVANAAFSLPLSALAEGFHRLYIRTKDGYKKWGHTNSQLFYKYVIPQTDTTITQVEYFVDTDPGFGKGTPVTITPNKNLVNADFTLPLSNLSAGFHRLYIRSKNGYRKWSQTNSVMFYKYTGGDQDTSLVQAEYFIDNDPGYGKGIAVALNPAQRWKDSTFQINITGLNKGTHTFYLRTKSIAGKWSLTNTDTFHIGTVPPAPAIVISKFTKRSLCAGEKFSLSFHKTGAFQAGNLFNVQLSDKNGSFSSPTQIGSLAFTGSAIVNCQLPSHLATGSRYRVRIVSTVPIVTGETSKDSLYIADRPSAPVITGDSIVNRGGTFAYSVPSVSGSAWLWKADSASVAATKNNASITWNVAGGNRKITVIETNKFGCPGDTGMKLVDVYVARIDSVSSPALTPCPGTSSSVTATVTGNFLTGNVFTAQMSDGNGDFTSPTNIGSVSSSVVGVKKQVVIPITYPFVSNGNGYKVRVTSSAPSVTPKAADSSISISKPSLGANKTVNKCPGASTNLTTLFNTGNWTVSWNTPRPDSVTAAGTYTIIVTNSRGCTDTADVVVIECQAPRGQISSNISSTSATLSWNPAGCFLRYEVQYRKVGTTTAITLTTVDTFINVSGLAPSTNYQWRIRTICRDTPFLASSYTGYVQFTTTASVLRPATPSIVEANNQTWKAALYPNPASQQARLQVTGLSEYSVSISNSEGRMLWQSSRLKSANLSLPIATFAPGVYLVSIRGNDENKVMKLVVTR